MRDVIRYSIRAKRRLLRFCFGSVLGILVRVILYVEVDGVVDVDADAEGTPLAKRKRAFPLSPYPAKTLRVYPTARAPSPANRPRRAPLSVSIDRSSSPKRDIPRETARR